MSSVDLRELAIDRGDIGAPKVRPRRHVMTRFVLPMLLIFGFLSLISWASWSYIFPPHAVTVFPVFSSTAEVQQEGTSLFQAAGWIEPRPTPVRVAALAPGVVNTLLVIQDQPVTRGEAVAELVKDDARLVYERALADLVLRKAELNESQASLTAAITRLKHPVHLEAALGESEANLAKIETQLNNLPFETRRAVAEHESAKKDFEGKMAARAVIAGIEIDIAKSKMDSTKALVEELQGRLSSLKKEQAALTQRRDALRTELKLLTNEIKAKDKAEAQIRAASARVTQAQVTVSEAKLQLDRMTIRAPIDGRIFRLIAHPGTRVGSGMTQMKGHDGSTVVTMYDPERLQIRVDVRFEDIPKVQLAQPVEINNPTLKSPIVGSVLFISSEADIQKNTLQVMVEIPNPPAVFKPEMLVDVTFLAPTRADQSQEPMTEVKLYVLQQLIHQAESGSFVWVADQSEGIARHVRIETGAIDSNGLVEVKSGLTVASRIISSGSKSLKDSDRIRIVGEETALGTTPQASDGSEPLNRLPKVDQ